MASRVTVYVKKDCGLCGPVWDTVQRVKQDIHFDVEKIDIGSDPELQRKYALEVPVVVINGRKAFKGSVTESAFRKKLERVAAHHKSESDDGTSSPEEVNAPPAPIILGLVFAAILGAGYFVFEGVSTAQMGRGRLASTLFRVDRPANDRAIDFQLTALDGKKVSLDDYRGKVLFINFWATWCPPCIEEMPSLRRFHEKLKGDPRFAFLAISADDDWTPVRRFFEKEPSPFTVVLDASGKLSKQYGTEKFPETYVVIDGRIVGYIVGPRDWDTWYAEAYARAVLDHGVRLKTEALAANAP